ncbi:PAAR domain-containing protein [Luteimonas sp. R10]|uniref:PAAR domain-containing protein n=1 Tax=Luteimonas sp. R10 TaxID=3108176 RepID=UPI00308ABA86|nr:PAAR domain-containing protein [Luteimonas sp. R10]
MSRPFIVVGDRIDHGGSVVSGSPFTDADGKPVCRVNNRVVCERHGPTAIVTGDSTLIIDGQPVARHGDKTACGATLISSQVMAFTDSGSGTGAAIGQPVAAAALAAVPMEPPELDLQYLQGANTPSNPNWQVARNVIVDSHAALMQAGSYREYDTEVEAAREWRRRVLPVADDYGVEVGALISQAPNGKYRLGAPWSSGEEARVRDLVDQAPRSPGATTAAIHTHPQPGGWVGKDRAFSFYQVSDESGLGGYGGQGDIQSGDLVYGYLKEVNVYIADSAGLHGWNFGEYRRLQEQDTMRAVRLGEVYRESL